MQRVGSRAQVFHGNAEQTAGGLRKDDLLKNKRGRIVPRSRHTHGKRAMRNILPGVTRRRKSDA